MYQFSEKSTIPLRGLSSDKNVKTSKREGRDIKPYFLRIEFQELELKRLISIVSIFCLLVMSSNPAIKFRPTLPVSSE
jgi:hypothetical protein